jgi:hypothetical protein
MTIPSQLQANLFFSEKRACFAERGVNVAKFLDWLLLALIVVVSVLSPLIVLEFVSGRY